jgi:hypothetical protein
MRLSTWSIGAGVLMVAFPMSTPCALANAPDAIVNASPIESAKAVNVALDRFAVPIASAHSSAHESIWTVGFMQKKKGNYPHGMLHPKPPNIHTRPVKKKSAWWPFGGK